jgi:hypothetical protein
MIDSLMARVRRMGWFTRAVCVLGIICTPLQVLAQSSNAVPIATSAPIVTGYGNVAINAPVRVCLATSFGVPCSTAGVQLYSDANVSQKINNPASTGTTGTFSFFVNSANFTLPQLLLVQVSTTPTNTYSYYFAVGSQTSSSVAGKGVVQVSNGAGTALASGGFIYAEQVQTGGGNNGIINGIGTNQTVIADPTYPSTENYGQLYSLPTSLPNVAYEDFRGGRASYYFKDWYPSPMGLFSQSTADTLGCFGTVQESTANPQSNCQEINNQSQNPGWSLGNNFFGGASGNGWSINNVIQSNSTFFGAGITEMLSFVLNHYGVGDTPGLVPSVFSAGGQTALSDEGVKSVAGLTNEYPNTFTGIITSGGAPGSTALKTSLGPYAGGQGVGRYLIDITQAPVTGQITNIVSNAINDGSTVTVSTPVTESNAYGTLTAAAQVPVNLVTPFSTSTTITVAIVGGTTGVFTTGSLVCMAGDYHDNAFPTAVGTPSGGMQTITLPLRKPHQSGGYVYQGGACGNTLEIPAYTTSGNGGQPLRFLFDVVGSVSTTQIIAGLFKIGSLNSLTQTSVLSTIYNTFNLNSGCTNGGSGTTVTCTYPGTGTLLFPYAFVSSPILIAGMSDSALNAVCTNMIWSSTSTFTCTISGLSGSHTSSTSGTAQIVTSTGAPLNNYNLWPEAEVLDVQDYTTSPPSVDGTFVLEPNIIQFANGDEVEEPHHLAAVFTGASFGTTIYNPLATTNQLYSQWAGPGACCGGTSVVNNSMIRTFNGAPDSQYIGDGGYMVPPNAWNIQGPFENGILTNPGPCFQCAMVLVEPQAFQYNNPNYQFYLDEVTGRSPGSSVNISVNPYNNALGLFSNGPQTFFGTSFTFGGGKVITAASTTSTAGFNVPQGTAPSSPANGDLWTTSTGVFVQINGATVGPLGTSTGGDTITSPNSTLSIGGTSTNTTLDIALGHSNTWTANQTAAKWIASTGFDISGATTAGHYLRNNGTDYVDNSIQVADVPTLNQNTTGTASNLSGTPTLPNGTTAATQTTGDNSTKIATDAFVIASALTNPMTTLGDIIYENSSPTAARLAGPTVGTVAYDLCSAPSGGVAQAPSWCLPGIAGRTVTGTTDTVATTDRGSTITYNSASSVAVTLTSAATLGNNFDFAALNENTGTVTFTAGAGDIFPGGTTTLAMTEGQTCAFSSPDNTNYVARCSPGQVTAGTGVTLTPSATGISISSTGGTPPLSSVTGSAAQATGTESAAGDQYTFAGVETANLTYPFVFTDANSAANHTNGALIVQTTGSSNLSVPLLLNEATAAGNYITAYSGATVTNGVASGGTVEFGVTNAGEVQAGSSAPSPTVGTGGGSLAVEGTAFTAISGDDGWYANSSNHCVDIINGATDYGCADAASNTLTLTNKSIAGSEVNSGTVAGTYLAAINLATSGNGGVTGVLPFANMAQLFVTNAQTATYQVLATDFAGCKSIPIASGTFTVTLVASGSQPASGQCIWIVNYGTGTITLARSGQNLNGGTTSLTIPAGSATAPTGAWVVSDGTNYEATLFGTSSGSGTVTASAQYDIAYYPTSGTVATVQGAAVAGFVFGSASGAPAAATATQLGALANITANAILKSGGTTSALTASSISDNGTVISSTEGWSIAPTSTGQAGIVVNLPTSTTANLFTGEVNGTTFATLSNAGQFALGSSPVTIAGSPTGGGSVMSEGSGPTAESSQESLWADSTFHDLAENANGGVKKLIGSSIGYNSGSVSSSIGSTNVATSANFPTGQYILSCDVAVTAVGSSPTLAVTIGWTDITGASRTQTCTTGVQATTGDHPLTQTITSNGSAAITVTQTLAVSTATWWTTVGLTRIQ